MKRNFTIITLIICCSMLLQSCSRFELSITKRQYRSGFHVDMGSQKPSITKDCMQQKEQSASAVTDVAYVDPIEPRATESGIVETRDNYSMRFSETPINKSVPKSYASVNNKVHVSTPSEKLIAVYESSPLTPHSTSDAAPMWVIILFAILIPPLGVFLKFGIVDKFWISLLLTLLFWLPGAVYSLIVVLSD